MAGERGPDWLTVDLAELRRRVRRRVRNPWLRAISYDAVVLCPADDRWWAGPSHRRATVYLSPFEQDAVAYVGALSPRTLRRFARVLATVLDVAEVELRSTDATPPRRGP